MGFFSKLFSGLKKTKDALAKGIASIFGKGELNDEFYENLEEILITADVGYDATEKIISNLKIASKKQKMKSAEDVTNELKKIIAVMMESEPIKETYPIIYTIVGVNGVGKTTSIGKLAKFYKSKKKDVILAAGDTYRAAASEQLSMWAEKVNVKIVKHSEGADPAAVVFDAIASSKAKKADVLIVDTAGRLHNNVNLMNELSKINRITKREWPEASMKNLLVLDATTGQNALNQVEVFNEAINIDGIILTKLDGTAKGGVILQIKEKYNIPVMFVGVGEAEDDLIEFNSQEFAEGIF